jgi:hypothetical protein
MKTVADFAKELGKDRFAFAKADAETFASRLRSYNCWPLERKRTPSIPIV